MSEKKSKGLGDTVEKVMEKTGVKHIVDMVSEALDEDCGCNKRKEKLNEKFPYKKD